MTVCVLLDIHRRFGRTVPCVSGRQTFVVRYRFMANKIYPNWRYAPINNPISYPCLSLSRLQGFGFSHTQNLVGWQNSIKTSRDYSRVWFLLLAQASEIDWIRFSTRRCTSATSHYRHTDTLLLEWNCFFCFPTKSRRMKAYLASSPLVYTYICGWKIRGSVFRRSFQMFYPSIFVLTTTVILSSSLAPVLNFWALSFCVLSPRWEEGSV
jgi:hypothetical protein